MGQRTYDGGMVASDRGMIISTNDSAKWWVEANNCDADPAKATTQDDDPDDETSIEKTVPNFVASYIHSNRPRR